MQRFSLPPKHFPLFSTFSPQKTSLPPPTATSLPPPCDKNVLTPPPSSPLFPLFSSSSSLPLSPLLLSSLVLSPSPVLSVLRLCRCPPLPLLLPSPPTWEFVTPLFGFRHIPTSAFGFCHTSPSPLHGICHAPLENLSPPRWVFVTLLMGICHAHPTSSIVFQTLTQPSIPLFFLLLQKEGFFLFPQKRTGCVVFKAHLLGICHKKASFFRRVWFLSHPALPSNLLIITHLHHTPPFSLLMGICHAFLPSSLFFCTLIHSFSAICPNPVHRTLEFRDKFGLNRVTKMCCNSLFLPLSPLISSLPTALSAVTKLGWKHPLLHPYRLLALPSPDVSSV